MTKREDGKETRFRLLNAACEVFAQKGYRDTKVAAICKRAGANVASVNYYFGDKASLYREAWQHALQNYEEPVFSETADASSRGRLQAYISVLLENFTVKGKAGQFSRLYLMEMVHPHRIDPGGLAKNHRAASPEAARYYPRYYRTGYGGSQDPVFAN